jgi:hypothetical protein
MINDVALITYTNEKCHDILRIHAGQIEKFANKFNSYVFSNKLPESNILNQEKHKVFIYDNSDPYYKHWVNCLENIKEKYIIYLQEDFLLYDNVDYDRILECKKFLEETDFSFTRFGKFELRLGIHRSEFKIKNYPDIKLGNDIYDAYCHDKDCYAFMMQASIWKKQDFLDLYNKVKADIWHESPVWNAGMRAINMKGSFHHVNSLPQLGKWHWESKVWPHICTAVGYGKWSITHHDHRLTDILRQYNVDPKTRGTR